jgi:fumarate hydratase class II
MSDYRVEKDALGEVKVPTWALWGAQTQRAVENFPISGIRFPRTFIKAIGLVKYCAAKVNKELGLLDEKKAEAIMQASKEVIEGKLDEHFPLDIFQTGSGTSTNMNANEVIANRACEILGAQRRGQNSRPSERPCKSWTIFKRCHPGVYPYFVSACLEGKTFTGT